MKEYIKTFYTTILRHKKKTNNDLTLCEVLNTFQIGCQHCILYTASFNICDRLRELRKCLK